MVLYEKTFALNPKSVYWSSKNKLKPDQVYKNSNLKYFFDVIKIFQNLQTIFKLD